MFIWRESQGFELFLPPSITATDDHAEARGMSADGRVVAGFVNAEGVSHPVRWSESTGMSDLEVPAPDQCEPTSLSKDGRIAAGICRPADSSPEYAVLWDSDSKLRRLDAVLSSAGLELDGEEFTSATVHESGRFVWGHERRSGQSDVAQLPSE